MDSVIRIKKICPKFYRGDPFIRKRSVFLKHLTIKNCDKTFRKSIVKNVKTTFRRSGLRHSQVKKVKKVKYKNV